MIPPPEIKELGLGDYLEIVRKRIWVVVAFVVVIGGAIAIYDFSSSKVYQATAVILLKSELPTVTGQETVVYREGVPTRETQLTLLSSYSLAERVAKKLGLISEFISNNAPREALAIVRRLRKSVEIVPREKKDRKNIIEIVVKGKNPLEVTNIANTWVREFIHEDMEKRLEITEWGIKKLKARIAEILEKLHEAEKNLNDFIRDNRIVTIPDVGVKEESLIEDLRAQKTQLEKEIIEKAKTYKEKHPQMVELKTKLKAVEEKLKEETDNLFILQDKALKYSILKREVTNYKSLYDSLAARIKELSLSQELVVSNIQILDEAQPPSHPIKPRPQKDILAAVMLAFVLGVVCCFILEYLDSTLKTSDDVEFYTNMPFLGYIPSAKKVIEGQESVHLVTHLKLSSQVAEAFRNARVSLVFSSTQEKPLKSIVITSAIPQEGKTIVASNLAIAFAQAKESTLLIDADMRRGDVAKGFDIKTKNGLSSILAGMLSLEETIISTSVPNLSAIPCGPYAPNPTELLNSRKLQEVLEEATKKFQRVIIDSPPLLSVADSLLLGRSCDGIVFVIRANFTDLKSILEAKKILGNKVKVIGALLNNVEIERDRYYYHHYYSSTKET